VSKKNKARRGASSRQAGRAPAATRTPSAASAGTAQAGPSSPGAAAAAQRVLASMWEAIETGDLLRAEVETAYCMSVPRVAGKRDPGEIETFISTVLVDEAVRRRSPEGAALLRLLMVLGTPNTRKVARDALAELTGAGVYPPEWVTQIGKATPVQAWRRYDVFGDDEAFAVTYSYGESEHAIVVQIDLTGIPMASAIGVSANAAKVVEAIASSDKDLEQAEQISLGEARRYLLVPLERPDYDVNQDLSADSSANLPIARLRARRLPADDSATAAVYTAADRAAAVEDFMTSPLAAQAVATDEAATRFWAEVLTGYSGRFPGGEPPEQVGPRKLAHILLGHVPNTFVLTPAQRAHLEPAVTAWVRWSAERRSLDEAATAVLVDQLPRVISRFDYAYNDPDALAVRGYVADLSTSDADVADLSRVVGRRMFAVPLPDKPPPDLGEPEGRRALIEAEFGACNPPPGMTLEEFLDAAAQVVEELWRDDGDTFAAAERMFVDGVDRHEIIHRLAGTPAPTMGTAIIR
jgi:hypothetical protein